MGNNQCPKTKQFPGTKFRWSTGPYTTIQNVPVDYEQGNPRGICNNYILVIRFTVHWSEPNPCVANTTAR